jgi:hypothetical protein
MRNQPDRDAFTREDRRLLNRILDVLLILTRQGVEMAIDLANLEAQVARNTSVDESVKTLVAGLAAQIAELKAGADPATQAKIDALVATLTADNDALAAAVVANTPQA